MSYLAEQNVIGSLLMDFNCISEVYDILSQEMFQSDILGCVYLEFQRGYDNHYVVNAVILEQKLRGGNYTPHDLIVELAGCARATLTSATIKTYANIVLNDYKAHKLKALLGSVSVSPDKIGDQIGKIIEDLEVLRGNAAAVRSKTLAEITKENKHKYFCENALKAKIKIGFPELDELLGGLEGGDMIVIGARPAVGKSAFVTQITSYLAKTGKRIGFYNLEMQEKQVYERFVVSESGIGLTRLRRATKFLGDEKERFDKANEILESQENIKLITGSRTIKEIQSESRHMGYDLIIIDYLQLVKPDRTYQGSRYAEVGAVSRAVKALAMDLNIPIIALSQLNRLAGAAAAKEPTMAELREAGDIEQDASVILLLWNLSRDDISKKGCKVEKQRQGKIGKVVLRFDGDLMKFVETREDIKAVQECTNAGEDIEVVQEWTKASTNCPFR